MLNRELESVMSLLSEHEYHTAAYLAEKIGASNKTIRNRVKALNSELNTCGARIISKPRFGYLLEIFDSDKFSKFKELYQASSQKPGAMSSMIPQTNEERACFLLLYFFDHDEYVKRDSLVDILFVSKQTLSVCLKNVEAILNDYGLSLERRPGYGIKLIPDEFNIRRLICDYFVRSQQDYDSCYKYQSDTFQILTRKIWDLLEKHQIHLTELALEIFVDNIYVACKRMLKGFYLQEMTLSTAEKVKADEKSFVDEVTAFLEEIWEINYTQPEKNHLLLYLAGKQRYMTDYNFIIHETLDHLSASLIAAIKQEYALDFSKNLNFRMSLNQHMLPFDIRMRYNLPIKNPILDEIKANYSFAYEMACRTMYVLKNHYRRDIPEGEVGYFALIYALALGESTDKKINNVLIVCSSGRGTSQLLKVRFTELFSDYIDQLYISDRIRLETFDFSKVDYVFSTVPIQKHIPVPIIQIKTFLGLDDRREIEQVLRYGHTNVLRNYYSKDRFFAGFPGSTKDEVLHSLCQLVMERESVDQDFEQLVFEREALAQMDYGTPVSMPHPAKQASDTSFVYVAVLEKPIKWNRFPVQVVLLTSIGRAEDKNRQMFYEATSKFILNAAAVDSLIEKPDYDHFMELLS